MSLSSRRAHWSRHIDQVLRSRHYTWLAEGLGGATPEAALTQLTADAMHMCKRAGLSWEQVLEESRKLYEDEESSSQQHPRVAA